MGQTDYERIVAAREAAEREERRAAEERWVRQVLASPCAITGDRHVMRDQPGGDGTRCAACGLTVDGRGRVALP